MYLIYATTEMLICTIFFRWLRIEAQLLQLDAQIKSNLGLDRANTDKCLQAMDDILALSIDPLMLKKHPHIVETVKRVNNISNILILIVKNFVDLIKKYIICTLSIVH